MLPLAREDNATINRRHRHSVYPVYDFGVGIGQIVIEQPQCAGTGSDLTHCVQIRNAIFLVNARIHPLGLLRERSRRSRYIRPLDRTHAELIGFARFESLDDIGCPFCSSHFFSIHYDLIAYIFFGNGIPRQLHFSLLRSDHDIGRRFERR